MTESTDYPYNKVNILPKVEGFRAVPRDPESKAHILYQTTSQAYGQVALEVNFCFLIFTTGQSDKIRVASAASPTQTDYKQVSRNM